MPLGHRMPSTSPSPLSPPPPPASRVAFVVSRVSEGLLLGLAGALVALSYYTFALYCENFGCIGRGLLWMFWAVLAALGGGMVLVLRAWQRRRGFGTRLSGVAAVLLWGMGAGHLLYWLGTMAWK